MSELYNNPNVEFIYEGIVTIIQCKLNDKLEDICLNFANKARVDIKKVVFIYSARIINKELTFLQCLNSEDKLRNKMSILVNSIEEINNPKEFIIQSKEIICPNCLEISKLKIKEYKVNIFDCKKNHKNDGIYLKDFKSTQNIDISKIFCDKCKKNRADIYKNKFYICSLCKINLCPTCIINHDHKEGIIDYEQKDYICKEHNDNYNSFCKSCKINICMYCENQHQNHEIIYFGKIFPDINKIKNKLNKLRNLIDNFNLNAKQIIDIYNNCSDNLEIYYTIYNNIIKKFDLKKRNYEIIYNLNTINEDDEIFNDLLSIINDKNLLSKFSKIINLNNKINQKKVDLNVKEEGLYKISRRININIKPQNEKINKINKEIAEKEEALNKLKESLEEKEAKLNLKEKKLAQKLNEFQPTLIGLQNIGATCYMNATLQALSNTDRFAEYFLNQYPKIQNNSNKKISNEMYKVLFNLWDENKKMGDYPPYDFKNALSEENSLFAGVQANDSKGLIKFLLERFHQELNEANSKTSNQNNIVNQMDEMQTLNAFFVEYFSANKSIITDLFYGIVEKRYRCDGCGGTKYNFQIFSFLEFPLKEVNTFMFNNGRRLSIINQDGTNPDINLYECFDYYQKIDLMNGKNQMYCNICNFNRDTYYGSTLYSLPNYLIINLNRGKGAVYQCNVKFPENLNLLNYVTNKDKTVLQLYAVICHYGPSSMSGHFIAYCKHRKTKKWYQYNDSTVTECTQPNEYNNGMPYFLFYKVI